MKIKDGFMLKTVAGQHIVVPIGEAAQKFNGMISLNDTGAFLWKAMSKDISRDGLVDKLLEEYEVEPNQADAGVDTFLHKLREARLIDE